ncbi:uncharacterized protein E0L32_002590 [Thyridium curvatum]|uniref:AB hydrolase-1 domain-containing protein n=1 Tax=Thyridium curvatum TaxID=1093900 RepID=A0A507BGW2_9PEZI|nr:uncharacterized protein E0L32_002590 [Thyridium curvatum]TPX18733.1 hypothetical protein E0L32_002590 [Thyridium curvatum]
MKPTIIAVSSLLAGSATAGASCKPVSFSVPVKAENLVINPSPDPNNATDIRNYLLANIQTGAPATGTAIISDTYTIKATFCEPPAGVKHKGVLQFLVHGATYNKSLWDGLGFGQDTYDWQLFATSRGYHTLAIDRLGHGENPQHPEPLAIVQGQIQIELMHNIVKGLKDGSFSSVPGGKYHRIAWVGHSYGSLTASHLAAEYPSAVDAFVLTGFSSNLSFPLATLNDLQSAAVTSPRFKDLPLGYVTSTTAAGRIAGFFAGGFDPAMGQWDFEHRDAVTLGEFLTPAILPASHTPYTGPVLVVTGDQDGIFCPSGVAECPATLAKTGTDVFPKSSRYDFFVVPDAGHCLSLHYTAPVAFKTTHDWLDKVFANYS